MDTGKTKTLSALQVLFTIGIIAVVETGVSSVPAPPLLKTGMARLLQIGLILLLFMRSDAGLAAIGLSRADRMQGLKKGAIWSAGFGLLASLAGGLLFLAGIHPLHLFSARLPAAAMEIVLFYIIGGLIAPVAEEIFFRGVIYGYLKHLLQPGIHHWSVPAALIVSTLLFAAAHQGSSYIAFPQLVGGIVFCLSYEIEKSLLTPMVIHATGNMALFTISLL